MTARENSSEAPVPRTEIPQLTKQSFIGTTTVTEQNPVYMYDWLPFIQMHCAHTLAYVGSDKLGPDIRLALKHKHKLYKYTHLSCRTRESFYFLTFRKQIVGSRRMELSIRDEIAQVAEAYLLTKVHVQLAIVFSLVFPCYLSIFVALMDQKIIGKDIKRDSR